jgi:hypothetical protein
MSEHLTDTGALGGDIGAAESVASRQRGTDGGGGVLRWTFAGAVAISTVIAIASFVLSFATLWDLATRAGLPRNLSWLWPVIVDGTILQATISVIALAPYESQRPARRFFWAVLATSALVSISSNGLHAFITGGSSLHPALAAAIATVAPISLLAATHGLAMLSRARTQSPRRTMTLTVTPARHGLAGAGESTAVLDVKSDQPGLVGGGDWPDWDEVAREMCAHALTSRTHHEVVEILRGKFQFDRSNREIGKRVDLHHSTVGKVIDAAKPILFDLTGEDGESPRTAGRQPTAASGQFAMA